MSLEVNIVKRLKGFTLEVDFSSAKEPLAILGASGSGKSMTLRCIAGIDTPTEGRIAVNGRVLFDSKNKINLPPRQRHIGYLFQQYALFPNMTVLQNVTCALHGADKREKAEQQLARFSLQGFAERYPAQLSGGQQQRVALARIFASEPEVLLLDEPFSALDAHLREKMQLEMMEILKGYGGDAIMVTHSRDEAYKLCPRLLVVEDGRAIAQGSTRQMFLAPGRTAVAQLTGCKNISRARPLSENTVLAEDWGLTLRVEAPLPEGLSHVGIRAHDFAPAEPKGLNAFPVVVHNRVESPFEWSVLCAHAEGPKTEESELWWKYGKGETIEPMPKYLAVSPHNVLLLT